MNKHGLIFIFIFSLALSAYTGEINHTYTVSISKDLNTLYVTAEFGNTDFYYLYAGSKAAALYSKNMYFGSNKSFPFHPETEELALHRNAAGQTLHYEFDIKSSLGKSRWSSARKVGDDVVVPADLWLWRPYSLKKNEHIDVHFDFPEEIKYSTPWTPLGNNTYRIVPTPPDWPCATVFGTFTIDTLTIDSCKLSVAFMDGNYKTTQKQLTEWLRGAARSVCMVYGFFPVQHAQILIFPGKPGREPVPFAMVIRGGGITINFYIDPSRPLNEFIADWTATHELSHCLLPMTSRSDAWFSEGLASYYQYILMGRDGRLNEQQTWQRLYNGFLKGIRDSRGKTLRKTAGEMHNLRAFRFVYWSGAAIFLKADIALREQSAGTKSLDSVLKQIQKNILPKHKNWSAVKMIYVMDSLSGSTVFSDIYRTYIDGTAFPVDNTYWARLGITVEDDNVQINDDAALADIRKNLLKNDY